jgi:hypothetical protein
MTWLVILGAGVVGVTLALWAIFVSIAVRGLKTEMPDPMFGRLL